MDGSNHIHKFCPVPSCKEDLLDRLKDAEGTLHKKVNAVYRSKISKVGVYVVATVATTIILGASTIMYTSYASARDKRMEQIKENSECINIVKEQQIQIKTKLNIELYHIREALKNNKELSERVLRAIEMRNDRGQPKQPSD